MAKAKKFGTFGGVFTPSILTILGVIMYLRFPSIIGQAGLINTIGIIVIAHIISITTSLSVASLSTDKPVQTGGTYFMISRSLGLPIGGTLGFALFVGLSFSVSLYLIGFAESFLQYWKFEVNLETIRITGSLVLLAVTTITFISTSLAIKSQYFIMAAIGLSLLSIFFGNHEFAPTEVNIAPLATAAPFMVLFGIFFPAVTGFEAGVSMSGDLKNPRRSLPIGAIMAVGVGFVVYIGLALFYAFTVDANALVNDPDILFKISLVPSLVIAGIWGATLSSALGSILGAPRILQAIAMDKIAPKIFAKGTGKTNEPRNALLVAFVIAEAGILIGDLDVIARIVSMFFITTYAFLNLASAIESWSSSDFRPTFQIPRLVSIVGAVSAFIVMILLDFLALVGATLALGLLYFFLQRKELILESGDAWSSFWTNLAKRALLRLSAQKANKRNWRPNIVLFSGGEQSRPHLVEMGLSLTGKLGALTDFNLVYQGKDSERLTISETDGGKRTVNHFTRQFACDNLEAGIRSVTSVYGFSGFEPNTVLMGWSKSTKNSDFLVNVLNDFRAKDLNAVFLDYDKNAGFGKKERIDVWWSGTGRHLSFSLNILRFLHSDPAWRDAEIRILIINSDTSLADRIHRNVAALLDEKRMRAEVKIISDDFGARTKESIISSESSSADLILIGLSEKENVYSREYIEYIGKISALPASLLILSPSEEFEEINVVDAAFKKEATDAEPAMSTVVTPLPEIENKVVRGRLETLDADCLDVCSSFAEKTIGQVIHHHLIILKNIRDFTEQNLETLEGELEDSGKLEITKTLVRNHQLFLININAIIDAENRAVIAESSNALASGMSAFLMRVHHYRTGIPETILVPFTAANKKEKQYKIPYQKAFSFYLDELVLPETIKQLGELETVSVTLFGDIRKMVFGINDMYEKMLLKPEVDVIPDALTKKEFLNELGRIEQYLRAQESESRTRLFNAYRGIIINLLEGLSSPVSIKGLLKKIREKHHASADYVTTFAENWKNSMVLINNTLYLDTLILSTQKIVKNIVLRSSEKIREMISEKIVAPLDTLLHNIEQGARSSFAEIRSVSFSDDYHAKKLLQESFAKITGIVEELPEEISLPETLHRETVPLPMSEYVMVNSNVYKVCAYYFETLFYETVYRETEQMEIEIDKAVIECKEANSMLLFRINNIQDDRDGSTPDAATSKEIFTKLIAQVNREKNRINTVLTKNENNAMVSLQNTFSKLFYHAISESERNISSQQREISGRKFGAIVTEQTDLIKEAFHRLLIVLLNSTSSGIILSKKYLAQKQDARSAISDILDLVEAITPKKKAYDHVPIFYRTLLSSGSKINDDFWVSRVDEIERIKRAVERHRSGTGGAVLVKGVHGAGKTTFSRYAAAHLFKKGNIFWVHAPVNGSVIIDDFIVQMRNAVGSTNDLPGIFSSLPAKSVVVINDLELWWERSKNGTAVLEKIIEIIALYGKNVFFIVNCNTHSYTIMNKLIPIDESFLSVVECSAFTTRQLQHLIMSRHKSSGLTVRYKGKSEEQISPLELSFLFNSYFIYTGGVPGAALNTWKANIIAADADSITVQKPTVPNIDILHALNPDWLVAIALFIQHKNIDSNKLSRISGFDKQTADRLIHNLVNAGIVVPKGVYAYTLGRNIEPFLISVCEEKGLI